MTETTTQTRYRVEGMDCAGCAAKIDTAIRRLPGVAEVSVSATAGTLMVRHSAEGDLARIERAVTGLGYKVMPAAGVIPSSHGSEDAAEEEGLHGHDHGAATGPWWKTAKARLTAASAAAIALAYAVSLVAPSIGHGAFIAAMLVGLVPIARRAFMAARAGSPFSIEMLMTIAAVGAVIIGAAEEAATVVLLFLVGELLEGVAAGRARASIQGLAALVPKTALLEIEGRTEEVPADSVAVGATVLVRPGDRIPADGIIIAGESAIDEAPVTGESTPKRKGVDATVFAGTAQESKAPTERFIDRFSRYYTPGVVAVAALVAILPPLLLGGAWGEWIYKGLAILLIGCPCALVISTPAAIAASLSAGARRGLLLKGGAVLESIGRITAAAFDKTGTLTEGRPKVTDVLGFNLSEGEVIRLAAALETGSSHPLATAILARAKAENIIPPAVEGGEALGGKGVTGRVEGVALFLGSPSAAASRVPLTAEQTTRIEALNAEGKSVAVLIAGDSVAGVIAMRDEPRADAKAGLKLLADAGIRTVMLTGDNRRTAEAVGQQLGIEVRAELLPEDKLRIVKELQSEGLKVAKIGDGINDAPALAAADIGIAMGGGTDVALETADAAVLHGRVADVAAMVDLSKRTMRNIHQNITIALGLKAVFLVTTIVGMTGLWPAILADTGATVLVTMNALRLLKLKSA
ncbi:MAG: heavy metal translocating P-type ATPase [Pseudomonas sp.]|uniref:heavy metal translocating P-type ATPase n=1 Tax=Pseudomonas sp. TaxID=306 RepID=UPI00120B34E2|nr:heavy metal translocating P-type ATPase [Pseudomonas sp.]RZI72367.1 MAG: heavy metal translocating P-type ATPase [Pseudomonas sp.]